ncbi:MAG: aminotransferase class V-fold PLP-dependent enzyme [Verrucomicrobia bacterium]|nr:aminotransferase class V-fold PLP-dependent enzyme [Verrucomicrobiota bacterium]
MTKSAIYLDYHSTTPVDPRVLAAMLPFFSEHFGNAASRTHALGWRAAEAVAAARAQVAAIVGARSAEEIVFTSGATESVNLAIKGVAWANRDKGDHIVTVATEHRAVLDTCRRLEQEGFRVTYLPVDPHGMIALDGLRAAITNRTLLVSVMAANNEVGTVAPLAEIARIARERGAIVHTDATQAVGKVPMDVEAMDVDLLSFSAHKMCGPKGVGALYVRRGVSLASLMDGGGHEFGLRSGTLNVPGIVGFGAACDLCRQEMAAEDDRVRRLRDRLHQALVAGLDNVTLNGHPTERLPGNLNLSFAGAQAEAVMALLEDVAVSSASACTTASVEPSHVLQAMGVKRSLAHCSIRFGLGRFTTEEEIDYAARRVIEVVRQVRAMSPMEQLAAVAARTC